MALRFIMMNDGPNFSLTAFKNSSFSVELARSNLHTSLHLLNGAGYPVIASRMVVVAEAEISIPEDCMGRQKIVHVDRPL